MGHNMLRVAGLSVAPSVFRQLASGPWVIGPVAFGRMVFGPSLFSLILFSLMPSPTMAQYPASPPSAHHAVAAPETHHAPSMARRAGLPAAARRAGLPAAARRAGLPAAARRAGLPAAARHSAPQQVADRSLPPPAELTLPPEVTDHFFMSSDGVRLHYLEAGPLSAHTIVFVPGWTMPAWIWMPQILAFSHRYHVVAFDPRGQGDSAIPATGYEPVRRGRDVAELIAHLNTGSANPEPVLLVGWSLGVLDTLASIHVAGDRDLAGLVLVDNSVGEEPPPAPVPYRPVPPHRGPPPSHGSSMQQFVRAMFRNPPSQAYLERLTQAALHTPEFASRLLLAYPVPRSYWRDAVYATKVPLLYVIRPRWVAQGENLVRNRPDTEMDVFTDAGHALFVDEPVRFNSVTERFIERFVWP
jgi:non-heme chloroperoxidase